jgi:hypothetical protein
VGNCTCWRDRASNSALGRTLDVRNRAHTEAQLAHIDAALAEAIADLFCEERQLVSPHAARYEEYEHTSPQRHGTRPFGDPRADGIDP